jgi:hypothetical protein
MNYHAALDWQRKQEMVRAIEHPAAAARREKTPKNVLPGGSLAKNAEKPAFSAIL